MRQGNGTWWQKLKLRVGRMSERWNLKLKSESDERQKKRRLNDGKNMSWRRKLKSGGKVPRLLKRFDPLSSAFFVGSLGDLMTLPFLLPQWQNNLNSQKRISHTQQREINTWIIQWKEQKVPLLEETLTLCQESEEVFLHSPIWAKLTFPIFSFFFPFRSDYCGFHWRAPSLESISK